MSTQRRGRGTPCSLRTPPIFPLFFLAFQLTFSSIESHPTLNFTVVVNPASGPGSGAGPDGNYTKEIPRLNSYANVRTVGYVSTDWAKRDVALALRDISIYGEWSRNASAKGIDMHGIFLDETPSQYDTASAEYYEAIASAVKSDDGLGKDPLVCLFQLFFSTSDFHVPLRQYQMGGKSGKAETRVQSGTPPLASRSRS